MQTPPYDQAASMPRPPQHTAKVREVLLAGGAALGILGYLGACLLLIFGIRSSTHGHFVYSLDDPYIHLALAERIRSGLYGMNAGEYASPSSSLVWPFFFVPFVRSALVAYLPLCLNLCFGLATIWMLALCVRRIFAVRANETHPRIRLFVLLLVFALNLPGLTLTGLEHVLEVLLSVCCAYGVLHAIKGESIPLWTLIAAALLPSLRYEGLLITLAVVVILYATRRIRAAVLLFVGSLIVPVGFSAFLLHLGLPAFPLSVLLKSSASVQTSGTVVVRAIGTLLRVLIVTLRDPERAPELILAIALGYLAYRNRKAQLVFVCALAAFLVAAIQTLVGPNGWFYRYEIYALAFTLLIAAAIDVRTARLQSGHDSKVSHTLGLPSGGLLIATAALVIVYMQPLLATPLAALGIYEQQYQVARFTHDFYDGSIAVNDLGLVAFRRSPQRYVLDLYGLASLEAARTRPDDKTPEWLRSITWEHHIGLVAVYPEWFSKGVPKEWTAVGKLCSPDAPISAYSSRVMLYEADPNDLPRLRQAVAAFAKTLPSGTTMDIDPANSYNTCTKP